MAARPAGAKPPAGPSYRRAVVSGLILFHLFCVILAPNRDSYLGAATSPWVAPYINFFAFNAHWYFFAPEPGPPPLYAESEALDDEGQVIARGLLPENPDPYFWRERQNRRIAMARYLHVSDPRAVQILAPFVCKTVPGARRVRLRLVSYGVPGIRDVLLGRRKIGDEGGLKQRELSEASCEGGGG